MLSNEPGTHVITIKLKQLFMGSYKQIYYHIVFGTKNREATIREDHEAELYKYIWSIITSHKSKLYRVNSMPDHIHICSDLHPTISLSNYIKDIKVASSLWMKESGKFENFKGWQDGYGAFTCSPRSKDIVINYIKNQKQHHKREMFYDEFKRLLTENDIVFDEKFLL